MPTAKEQRFIDYVMLRLDVDPYARRSVLTEAGAAHADVSVSTARGYLQKMLTGPLTLAYIRGSDDRRNADRIMARRDRVDVESHGQFEVAYVRNRPRY